MDKKYTDDQPRCPAPTGRRRVRLGYYLAVVGLVALAVVSFVRPGTLAGVSGVAGLWPPSPSSSPTPVPLEAHIMSKCPDALDCLRDLVLPAMMQVVDKVSFTLSFVGTETGDGGVACMHGPAECMGNILELCAAALYPDPKIYLGFTLCLSREYAHIPDRGLVEACALEHAVDIARLDACATADDGQTAMDLLKQSVRRSRDAGVARSCTVRLDDRVYCVRDGGAWVDCAAGSSVHDLVASVERLYN